MGGLIAAIHNFLEGTAGVEKMGVAWVGVGLLVIPRDFKIRQDYRTETLIILRCLRSPLGLLIPIQL